MMKNDFCLKSDTVTITPSDMENLWESDWIIAFRKGEKEQLGTATFAGEKLLGTVPLNVELMPRYRNRGLGTEIIRMMVNWAFLHKNIFEVVSKVEHENDKGVNALQKAGFVFRGNEGKVETYSIIKRKTAWTGVYAVVGIFVAPTGCWAWPPRMWRSCGIWTWTRMPCGCSSRMQVSKTGRGFSSGRGKTVWNAML